MLVTSKQIIINAQKGKYAVGSFNTSNLEITKAIVAAAEKLKAPVIVETSEKAIGYAGLESIAAIVNEAAKNASVPVALHLDHGQTLEMIKQCLDVGYTSIMFDGSRLSFTENQIISRQAAEMAHRRGVPCEGELGSIGQGKTESNMTDPDTIIEFTKNTGIDFLAVSIGSKHGAEGDEKLDIDLLKKIKRKTAIPLVLHGASGVSDADIKTAIANGIAKINIDTDIRHTFSKTIHKINQKYADITDPRDIMTKVMEDIQKVVEDKIKLFGSDNKA